LCREKGSSLLRLTEETVARERPNGEHLEPYDADGTMTALLLVMAPISRAGSTLPLPASARLIADLALEGRETVRSQSENK